MIGLGASYTLAMADKLKYIAFAVLVIATSCAVPRAGIIMPDGSTVYTLHPRLEFVDDQRQTVSSIRDPRGVLLIIAAIPGEIYGEVRRDSIIQLIHARPNSLFLLDLGKMTPDVNRMASSLRTDFAAMGLIVTPPNTRFARIATLAEDEETKTGFGGVGFLDSSSREGLILVYVDRACTITGTQHLMGDNRQFDVTLRHPGFHWIRLAGTGTKSVLLTDSDGVQDIIYSISQP